MDSLYTDDIEYNKENVLVIIEGLSMYLHENDIRQIFSIIEKAFNKSTVMPSLAGVLKMEKIYSRLCQHLTGSVM